jgi:hypothetical protein
MAKKSPDIDVGAPLNSKLHNVAVSTNKCSLHQIRAFCR